MPSTERRQRYIDKRLENSGGGTSLTGSSGQPAGPAVPAPPAPQNLVVDSTKLLFSAVSPMASASLSWRPPVGTTPQRYLVQWSLSAVFAAATTRQVAAAPTTAEIDGLPVGALVYFRVAAVVSEIQGGWSNTASATMPQDTTPPAAPTGIAFSWSGLTGDLTITWVNPTSANFRDVRVRIFASNGGALLREGYAASGAFVWTRGQHYADTSGVYDPSVYVVLTSRSWGGVFSATDLTGTATLAVPATPAGLTSSWAGDTGTAGPNLRVTWTRSDAVAAYQLSIDGVTAGRERLTVGAYDYPFGLNQAEHGGAADPVLSLSLVAVDALGQPSTAATATATNAAPPATTISVFAGFSSVGLTIGASAALDLLDYRVRVYRDTTLVRTVFFSDTRPTYAVEDGDGAYTFDVAPRDVFGQVGTASAQTGAVVVTDLAGFINELRSGAIYSDQPSTNAETLYDAYTDDNRASGGISYASNAGWVRWIRFERDVRDRYRTITLSMTPASGTSTWYIRTSEDASAWSYFAGPVASGRVLTGVASAAAAQTAAVSAATLGGAGTSRVDLPSLVSARYVEVWLRNTGASTRVDEFYPRRLVQSDDLEAESIRAVNIAAGTITGDRLTATAINGFAITGVTISGSTIFAGDNQAVRLDSDGIALRAAAIASGYIDDDRALRIIRSDTSALIGAVYGQYGGTTGERIIIAAGAEALGATSTVPAMAGIVIDVEAAGGVSIDLRTDRSVTSYTLARLDRASQSLMLAARGATNGQITDQLRLVRVPNDGGTAAYGGSAILFGESGTDANGGIGAGGAQYARIIGEDTNTGAVSYSGQVRIQTSSGVFGDRLTINNNTVKAFNELVVGSSLSGTGADGQILARSLYLYDNLSVEEGLNVGTATGAGAGEIRTSSNVTAGTNTVEAYLICNGPTTTNHGWIIRSAGLNRWAGESVASNNGDFYLSRSNDAGAYVATPFIVSRASQAIAMHTTPDAAIALVVNGASAGTTQYAFAARNNSSGNLFWVRNDGYAWFSGTVDAADVIDRSDARLKRDVADAPDALRVLAALRVRQWRWDGEPDGPVRYGPIAQEVAAVAPELVVDPLPGPGEASGAKGLRIGSLLGLQLAALQQLAARVDALEAGRGGGPR